MRHLLHQSELRHIQSLLDYFRQHPAITLVGPDRLENRAPTLSIQVAGHQPLELAQQLGQQGILCGAGHFYSWRLLEALGIDPQAGVLRFSMVHYTSANDVVQLLQALDGLIGSD